MRKIEKLRGDLERIETRMYWRRSDGNVQSEDVQEISKEYFCVHPVLLLYGERSYAMLLQTPIAPQSTPQKQRSSGWRVRRGIWSKLQMVDCWLLSRSLNPAGAAAPTIPRQHFVFAPGTPAVPHVVPMAQPGTTHSDTDMGWATGEPAGAAAARVFRPERRNSTNSTGRYTPKSS